MNRVGCPRCQTENAEFAAVCRKCGAELPLLSSEATQSDLPLRSREATDPDDLRGRTIGRYQVLEALGRGGMGVVYRAIDRDLDREVALKFLAATDSNGSTDSNDELRLLREARALAALDHPNVGAIYELGEFERRRFLALALYDGETLDRRLARGPLPLLEALSYFAQAAAALGAAHAAGIVHRDLKPSNLMIVRGGRIKLLDFGLAKTHGASELTERGVAVGTVAYMAPEQLRAEPLGPAADVWALGIVFHEMVSGQRPFGREVGERQGLIHQILNEPPPPLQAAPSPAATVGSESSREIPREIAQLVERCLAKDPAERPANGSEILVALEAAGVLAPELSETAAVRLRLPEPALPKQRRFATRPVVGLSALAVAGLVAATIVGMLRSNAGRGAPIAVAVAPAEISGALGSDEAAFVAINLQAAALRALAALQGVSPLDPSPTAGTSTTHSALARSVGAAEVLSMRAACPNPESCRLEIQRIAGADDRVLWAEALHAPPSEPKLFAEAVSAAIRRGYASRKLVAHVPAMSISEADYRRHLELRKAALDHSRPLGELLGELSVLRRRAPEFVEVAALEAAVARQQFERTGDAAALAQGLEALRTAEAAAPDDARLARVRFDLELRAERYAEAEKTLEHLAAIEPGTAVVFSLRARLAERQGDPEAAVEWMNRAVLRQPSWQLLLTLANLEYRTGQLDAARGHLRDLLARAPGNPEGIKAWAQIELLSGDPAQAVALYRQLDKERRDPQTHGNEGVALLLLRRPREAEAAFRRALALAPQDPGTLLNLADALTLSARQQEARAIYREVITRTEGAPQELWTTRAQALAHGGEPRRAVETIAQALRASPENPQLAAEAAIVYALVGDRNSALAEIDRALQGGVDRRWFSFPWFDSLRDQPPLSVAAPASPSVAPSAP